jgi:dimethylamine/trimethylamine dehydrogenase
MLVGVTADSVELACVYSGPIISLPSSALAFVTAREPDAALYRALVGEDPPEHRRIQAIGDCDQPALIAHAVYAGHRAGRELGHASAACSRDRWVAAASASDQAEALGGSVIGDTIILA